MAINFDALPQDKPVGALLPKGFAKAVISKAEMRTSKSTGAEYLSITFDCTAKDGSKGKLFDMLFDSDKELLRYKLQRFITALRLNLTGSFELKDLCKIITNKQLVVDVSVDESGDRPRNSTDVFSHEIYYPINEWAALIGGEEINAADGEAPATNLDTAVDDSDNTDY